MMNSQNLQLQLPVQDLSLRGRSLISKPTTTTNNKAMVCPAASSSSSPGARGLLQVAHPSGRRRRALVVAVRAAGGASGGESSSSSSDGGEEDDDKEGGGGGLSRDDLERLVGTDDDAKFNGLDLANLIRKKYGRSYDVTLIKKEFMGRDFLAMNVMWKYREQRSFPLSEEEYLLRLDDVANTLKCWGAVAHVRNTLEKLKERPRIGKAVSIFIDMDQTGGRANEWIYKYDEKSAQSSPVQSSERVKTLCSSIFPFPLPPSPTTHGLRRRPLPEPPSLLTRRHLLVRLLSAQTQLATPPTPATPADLSRLKSTIRDAATGPDSLATLFLSALHHPAFLADRPLFALSVHRLASAGRRDLVASVLSAALTARPTPHPSEGFLLRLIALYSAAGMPDHALTVFRLVDPPSDRALSALLSAYHDNRLYDRAVRAFNTLPAELGIKPGIVSHNVLLKALVAGGDVAAARKVFDGMPDAAGVRPDIVSCNEILKGYLSAGDDAAFDQLVKEIAGPERRLKPNVGTYNLRMSMLCSKGRSFEAAELLDAMGANGVPPNRASFNTVIKGLCNEGEVGAAMALFERMPEVPRQNGKGVSPNFETYIMLLEALVSKSLFDPALEVCKECLRNKWAPPFQAVKGLVQGLLKSRKAKHAREVLVAMRKAVKGDAKEEWIKVEAQFLTLLPDKKA